VTTRPLPPGPPQHFFSGNLPEFKRERLGFLTRVAREYGDCVPLRFGPKRILLVSDPQMIEEVLATQSRHFIKHFALRINPIVLGNGLLTSEGEFWRRQRRLAQPAFHRQRIASYSSIFVDYTRWMLAGWSAGQIRDIHADMMALTLGIAAKTLFNADVSGHESETGEALEVAQQRYIERFNSLIAFPMAVPTPGNLRLRRAVNKLDRIIYGFIRQRRASHEMNGDLLSLLLNARDEDDQSGMTDEQLRDEAMTLFLAGHETTALALSWTWMLLAKHPDVAARLHAEVDDVLAGRFPGAEDVARLKFAESVILESMRLYPPAFVIGREATADCTIGGYPIPRGMTILMPQWVVHRDGRYFPEPERFHPERWLDGTTDAIPRYAYFPFGGGPRLCIGQSFAMMEMVLVLSVLAQHYRFTLVPDHPIVPAALFTLRPQHGIKAVIEPRAAKAT